LKRSKALSVMKSPTVVAMILRAISCCSCKLISCNAVWSILQVCCCW
jgi:hypothetical protein